LERGAYRLSVTQESVLNIALSVGFQSHETFSRAFKRRFNHTPSGWRRATIANQKQWTETNRLAKHDGCELSAVTFVTLNQ